MTGRLVYCYLFVVAGSFPVHCVYCYCCMYAPTDYSILFDCYSVTIFWLYCELQDSIKQTDKIIRPTIKDESREDRRNNLLICYTKIRVTYYKSVGYFYLLVLRPSANWSEYYAGLGNTSKQADKFYYGLLLMIVQNNEFQ